MILRSRTLYLTLLAVTAVGAVMALSDRDSGGAVDNREQRVAPGLEDALNDVTGFTITAKGGSVTLSRDGASKQWQVASLGGYPADRGRVVEALIGLARSNLIEEKTAKAENYPRLQIGDEEAIRWQVKRSRDVVADVLIGRKADGTNATYIRYPDDPKVWLASGALRPFTDGKDWARQQVLDIKPERIKSVAIHHTSGGDVTIARDDPKGELKVSPLPPKPNDSLIYQSETTIRALAVQTMTAVTPQSKLTASTGDTATFTTFDGLTLVLRFATGADGDWVTIEPQTAETAGEAVKKEADDIAKRTGGWAYQLAPYIMAQLRITPADLSNYKGPVKVSD